MAIGAAILAGLQFLSSPVTEYVKGKAARTRVKEEGKLKIELARITAQIQNASREDAMDLEYDLQALKNMKSTWKDEFLLIVYSFPFILSFLAPFIDAFWDLDIVNGVARAWETVGLAPSWYQWLMLGVAAATFGLRWLFQKANPLKGDK